MPNMHLWHLSSYWSNFTLATRSCCRETKPGGFVAAIDNFLLCCRLEKFECCCAADDSWVPSGVCLSQEGSSHLLTIMPQSMWEKVPGFQSSMGKDRESDWGKDQDQQEELLVALTVFCRRKPQALVSSFCWFIAYSNFILHGLHCHTKNFAPLSVYFSLFFSDYTYV